MLWGNAYYIKHCRTEYVGDSFLGIDLAMSHSLEGRVGDTAPVCRLLARRTPRLPCCAFYGIPCANTIIRYISDKYV